MDEQNIEKITEIDFQEFLTQMEDPAQWVLFLGDNISSCQKERRREKIFEPIKSMEQEKKENSPYWQAFCQAARQEDMIKVSDLLFGNIWDGVSFLGEKEEIYRKHRQEYAESLARKEEINIRSLDANWKKMMKRFRYMVITTCQDETVEAFLEYEQSMPVDEMVTTPYIMTTSSTWDRWVKKGNGDLQKLYSHEKNMLENVPVLVKLYGSRNMPNRLLLSKDDMEQYYPAETENPNQPLTAEFLKTIFRTKNILFIGVNFEKNHVLPLADGILKLLETEPDGKKRYVFASEKLPPETMERYYMQTISNFDETLLENTVGQMPQNTFVEKKDHLSEEEILENFGRNYIRRPLRGIFKDEYEAMSNIDKLMNRELKLLKNHILEIWQDPNQSPKWNDKSVRKLALAANNLADFYDLDKVFKEAKQYISKQKGIKDDTYEYYEAVTDHMLNDRLSSTSKNLHQILTKYKKGFPLGFLQLLSKETDNEEELRKWKKAGIQLTNSGIYLNLNYRKNVQKRLSYADNVMQTAGTYPEEKRKLLENKMKESCTKALNSFFYPVESGIIHTDENWNQKVEEKFLNLFVNLEEILTRKTKNYQQIHSLLQTEMTMLFKLARDYEDEQLDWKPSLYYQLLWDSRMFPEKESDETDRLETELKSVLEKLKSQIEPTVSKKDWKYMEGILKYQLAHILNKSRSLITEDEYKYVLEECQKAEDVIERCIGADTHMPEHLFMCKMHLHFIKQKIYIRRSTILETEQHREQLKEQLDVMLYASELQGQNTEKINAVKTALDENLKEIQKALKNRKDKTGHSYREFFAQYYYFKGEYYYNCLLYRWKDPLPNELKQEADAAADLAEHAKSFLKMALESYNSYQFQYEIQQADVLRQLADLYCLQSKSISELSGDTAKKKEYMDRCYEMLIDAYIRYRNNFELHGIADVLCSMRCAEELDCEKKLQSGQDDLTHAVKQMDELKNHFEQMYEQYKNMPQDDTNTGRNKKCMIRYYEDLSHLCIQQKNAIQQQEQEDAYSKKAAGHRSPDSFLKLAKDLYEYLGDECSLYVLQHFPFEKL